MANILKITKGVVKTISVIIMLAFFFNSINGIRTVYQMAEINAFSLDDPEAGDFVMNFENLTVDISVTINNPGIYPLENIIIGINFSLESGVIDYTSVLDTDSSILAGTPDVGVDILRNQTKTIELHADLPDFELNTTQIGQLFGLNGTSWDMADLLDANFNAKLNLFFKIDYAFKQYQIKIDIDVAESAIKAGFA